MNRHEAEEIIRNQLIQSHWTAHGLYPNHDELKEIEEQTKEIMATARERSKLSILTEGEQ